MNFNESNYVIDPDNPSFAVTDFNTNHKNLDRGLIVSSTYLKNSYEPIKLVLKINSDNLSELTQEISNCINLITTYTQKIIKTPVVNVEYYERENYILFIPMTKLNDQPYPIYEDPSYLSKYYSTLNLDKWKTYTVLSDDPLLYLVLSNYPEMNIIEHEGIYLTTNYDLVDEIEYEIDNYKRKGYFSYKLDQHNLSDFYRVYELSYLWKIDIVYDQNNVFILHSDLVNESWFRKNVIKTQYPTSYTLTGEWQFDHREHFQEILTYIAILSYKKMAEEDMSLQIYTHTATANNDLSISFICPSLKHLIKYEFIFNNLKTDLENYQSFICFNLIEGVNKRYQALLTDPKSNPLLIKSESENYEYIMVLRSPLVTEYKDGQAGFESVENPKIKFVYLDNEYLMTPEQILSRQIYDEDIINKAYLMEWGWRGLFDLSVNNLTLKGLYSDFPKRYYHPTTKGELILGDDERIYVMFDSGHTLKLLDSGDYDLDLLNSLWKKGRFLNNKESINFKNTPALEFNDLNFKTDDLQSFLLFQNSF